MRTFTLIAAFYSNGCPTTIKKNTTYKGLTPSTAGKKAFTELCRMKRIKGVATFYIVIREKTKDSMKKTYSYFVQRKKLKYPIVRFANTSKEFKIMYQNIIHSKKVPSFTKCMSQSKSRIKKKTEMNRGGGKNNVFKTGIECVICLDQPADHIIKPCGHLCLCKNCKNRIIDSNVSISCPICREKIVKIEKYNDWFTLAMGPKDMGLYTIEEP